MFQFLVIAVRNLIKAPTRTILIGGAIASVTALLVLLNGITAGIQDTILNSATALATGHVNVAGFYKLSQTSASPVVTGAAKLEELARRTVPEATLIVDRVKAYGNIISDSNSLQSPMQGVNFRKEESVLKKLPLAKKNEYIENWRPASPDEPEVVGDIAELAKPGHIVLFSGHAKKLKVKVGDVVTISMPTWRNISNTKDVKVAAILQNMGLMSSFTVFMNHQDTRELYQLTPDATGQIMVYLPDHRKVAEVEERLRKAVADAGFLLMDKDPQAYFMKFDRVAGESWTGQKIDITTWQDETSYVKWILDIFGAMTFIATFVLLVIVVLGLVNTLWMSIRERTGEVGTLRAIGLQRRQVILMFGLESFVLAGVSALVGIVAGSVVAAFINWLNIPITSEAFTMFLMSSSLTLAIKPGSLLSTFLVITLFLMMGGLYPAWKASRLKPIMAINQIE